MNTKVKFKRLATKKVKKYLDIFGGVILIGPRFVGKTTMAKDLAKKYFLLTDHSVAEQIKNQPKFFLSIKQKPIAIDEWQIIPEILPAAKNIIDETNVHGLVIFTGSIWLNYRNVSDPGIGRFGLIKLWPMSFYETNESEGKVSLVSLLNNQEFYSGTLEHPFDLFKLAKIICRGGFPGVVNSDNYLEQNQQYLENMLYFLKRYSDADFKEQTMENFIFQCAINNASTSNWANLHRDFMNKFSEITQQTFLKYRDLLETIFLIDFCDAYTTNLSSNKRILKASKMYFCDPCLVAASLKINEGNLVKNLNLFGLLFENLVYRDLKNYADYNDAKLFYYRDYDGNEVDFIMQFQNGKYLAIEVKLGFEEETILKAARSLIKYKRACTREMQKMEQSEHQWNFEQEWIPEKLIIITGLGQFFYKKIVDGEEVYVVPIGALMP